MSGMMDDLWDMEGEDEDTQANKYLIFNTEGEAYGVPIQFINEIIEMQKITEVPDMPDFIEGVINLRGMVIPVIDIRKRFGLPERDYDNRTCIIIITIEDKRIGCIVDSVSEIMEILPASIAPPPQFRNTDIKNKYIEGLGKVGENVKILLNIEKLIFEEALEKIEEMTQEKSPAEVNA